MSTIKFDFNPFNLQQGSQIVNDHGRVLYTVVNTTVPYWETPSPYYLNDCLWVQVVDSTGEQFAQPVQWFNAVIGANEGCHVVQEQSS